MWLHGDVFWSSKAINTIKDKIANTTALKTFGRKRRNTAYGNNGGEDFGWYIPHNQAQILRAWYLLTRDLYISSPLYRLSTWEVVSLMSFAAKLGAELPEDLKSQCNDPLELCQNVSRLFASRDFPDDLWVEIDDETEDFDFPIEYINRLFLMVEKVGLGEWS